jgi:hypothetical protein
MQPIIKNNKKSLKSYLCEKGFLINDLSIKLKRIHPIYPQPNEKNMFKAISLN